MTSALATGIAASAALAIPPLPAFALSLAGIGAAWFFFARRRDSLAALLAIGAVAAIGAARLSIHDRDYQANPLHALPAAGYVDIEGRLARSPGREPDRDILFVDVRSFGSKDGPRPVRGRLRLGVPSARGIRPRIDYLAGDAIRVSPLLSSGGSFRNFGA
ncbi:MAG TPA: DUF4131 domain-containing protein, partial [Acidobacteriota bacterium]|nr:DUF4131 domain-containing protein [Acidobacteriota bacterium]